MLRVLAGFGLLAVLCLGSAWSFDIPEFSSLVVDRAKVLSRSDRAELEQLLTQVQKQHRAQIAILTVPTLAGETIESVSIQVVDRWKIGDQKRDDGILILAAIEDRRVRIEVGQGLEGVVPDVMAARIIDHVMRPRFRQRDYRAGLEEAVFALTQLIRGDAPSSQSWESRPEGLSITKIIFLIIFLLILLPARIFYFGRRRRSWYMGSGGWSGGMGRGSGAGWGGGFGGGGFGGGGGGGFSGGGSSGGW